VPGETPLPPIGRFGDGLHGPVGSSKSTIARLLKKGLEHYSKTDAGKCYT